MQQFVSICAVLLFGHFTKVDYLKSMIDFLFLKKSSYEDHLLRFKNKNSLIFDSEL